MNVDRPNLVRNSRLAGDKIVKHYSKLLLSLKYLASPYSYDRKYINSKTLEINMPIQ